MFEWFTSLSFGKQIVLIMFTMFSVGGLLALVFGHPTGLALALFATMVTAAVYAIGSN